jgi:hypothetical protein
MRQANKSKILRRKCTIVIHFQVRWRSAKKLELRIIRISRKISKRVYCLSQRSAKFEGILHEIPPSWRIKGGQHRPIGAF